MDEANRSMDRKKKKKKNVIGKEGFLEGVVFQPHRLRQFLGSCGPVPWDFWHLQNRRQARVFFRIQPITGKKIVNRVLNIPRNSRSLEYIFSTRHGFDLI